MPKLSPVSFKKLVIKNNLKTSGISRERYFELLEKN